MLVAGLLLAGPSVSAQPVFQPAAPAKAKATAPEIPVQYVANFLTMPPGIYMGEVMGVATNSRGHVFVFVRSGETQLFEFDQNGTFVKEWGIGSYANSFAHAVRVDKDDNVWTVDEGTNIIFKYSPEGKQLLVLGKRPDPLFQLDMMPGSAPYTGANRPYSFHRPTDVGWDPQGNIFVSDGYGDSRIVKYDKNGRFLKSVGTRGSGPLQFSTPHGLAVDAKGMVYVADRGNRRIVVLDNDLNQKTTYEHVGTPPGLCISTEGPRQYLYSPNWWGTGNDWRNAPNQGEIYKMELDGTVLGRFGKAGRAWGELSNIHTLDCRNPDVLYLAEVTTFRVQKVVLKPQQTRTTSGAN
jgi:hypothetical protein